MLFTDTFLSIKDRSESIFRIKGSKFLGYAIPLKSETEVKPAIETIKAEHPKARHHCWAYRLTPDRNTFRINDDGEPSGTAGRPILNSILSADVTNVLVVVVRYFGGTLLGVPGLINAYKTTAQDALAAASIVEFTINDTYRLSFDYPLMNEVMRVIKKYDTCIIRNGYNETCFLTVEVRRSKLNSFLTDLESLNSVQIALADTL